MRLFTILLPILTVLLLENLKPISASQFISNQYAEKKCAKGVPAKNLDTTWIAKIAAWFIPMGSQYIYHRWAERLTNQSLPLDGSSFNQLCLKQLFLASEKPKEPYLVVVGGLKKATLIRCKATGSHTQECDGVLTAPDYEPGVDTKDMIVATDNKNYLVMLSCVRNKFKSWYVMTPTSELTDANRLEIIKGLKQYGFKRENAALLPYQQCPKGVLNPTEGVQKKQTAG